MLANLRTFTLNSLFQSPYHLCRYSYSANVFLGKHDILGENYLNKTTRPLDFRAPLFGRVFCDRFAAFFLLIHFCIIYTEAHSPQTWLHLPSGITASLEMWVSSSSKKKAEPAKEPTTASFPSNGTVKAPMAPGMKPLLIYG